MMKNFYVRRIILCSVILISIFFAGCAEYGFGVSTDPGTPKVLTPEEIESIFAEVSFEEIDKYPIETDENGDDVVYWVESGSVWHVSKACSTIKKADPTKVKIGSVQDAINVGKERSCKICGANYAYSDTNPTTECDINLETFSQPETQRYQKEYGENGELIVFWLENSKVWHESRYCSSLSRSDPTKFISGFVDDAIKAGKERVCKNCSN